MKSQIAAIMTAGVLGGLAGFALGHEDQVPAANQPTAAKPAMHTKVVHRTIHVTKHAKPKHPPAGAGGHHGATVTRSGGGQTASATQSTVATGSSSTGAATSGATYSSEPVTTSTSGAIAAVESESSAPVTTSTSGASATGGGGSEGAAVTTATSGGGGGGGGESEGGDGGDGGGGGGDD
jgi:hypothetical protein